MTAIRLEPGAPAPACPRCGGGMHDNRNEPARAPNAPAFRCKNPDCLDDDGRRTAVWLARAPKNAARKPASPPQPQPDAEPSADLASLAVLHSRCFRLVVQSYGATLSKAGGDVAGALSALTAQLFIECTRRGVTR